MRYVDLDIAGMQINIGRPAPTQRWGQHAAIVTALVLLSGMFGGCGGELGLLGFLGVSEEDIQAAADAQEAFQSRVDALPSVRVRIVNETDAIVRADFEAGLRGPEIPELSSPIDDVLGAAPLGESYMTSVDSAQVLVAARGMVEGTIKCGEVLAISAAAPFDLSGLGYGGLGFGLYIDEGNVSFTGVGAAGQEGFTGDRVTTARFIRPLDDGLNCGAQVLVVRIQETAADAIHDPQTGQLTASRTAGRGEVLIE